MQQENRFILILKKIGPPLIRVINALIYYLITLIKSTVSYAIKQIKMQQ